MDKKCIAAMCFFLCLVSVDRIDAWGAIAHRCVLRNAIDQLPACMGNFINQDTFFISHAGSADSRRYVDSTEGKKHYIDLEDFPSYNSMSCNYDSLVDALGLSKVEAIGVLPWAVVWMLDSLVDMLKQKMWAGAYYKASDLAHYIADAFMPLHCTANYDGQLSGNKGIHARYESAMIERHDADLTIASDSICRIAEPLPVIWDCILHSNCCADSILKADYKAKKQSGWDDTGAAPAAYVDALWESTQSLTLSEMSMAAALAARFWYTAYVNAGLVSVQRNTQYEKRIYKTEKSKYSLVIPFTRQSEIYWRKDIMHPIALFNPSGRMIGRVGNNAGNSRGIYIIKMRNK